MEATVDQISALLHETGETHHRVFRIVDGADDDWASWYADWLTNLSELPALLRVKPVRSELTWLLVSLDKKYAATQAGEPWGNVLRAEDPRPFQPTRTLSPPHRPRTPCRGGQGAAGSRYLPPISPGRWPGYSRVARSRGGGGQRISGDRLIRAARQPRPALPQRAPARTGSGTSPTSGPRHARGTATTCLMAPSRLRHTGCPAPRPRARPGGLCGRRTPESGLPYPRPPSIRPPRRRRVGARLFGAGRTPPRPSVA